MKLCVFEKSYSWLLIDNYLKKSLLLFSIVSSIICCNYPSLSYGKDLDLSVKDIPNSSNYSPYISLEDLIRGVVDKHPLVQQARGESDASIAEIGVGVAAGKPKLALALNASAYQGAYSRNQIAPTSAALGPSVTVRYPLWDRDQIDADVALRTSRSLVAESQINIVKLTIAQQIAEAYNEVLRQKSLISVTERYVVNLEALSKDLYTVARFDKGKLADATLGSAKVEIAHAILSAKNVALKDAMNKLRQLSANQLRREHKIIEPEALIALDFNAVLPPSKDMIFQALDSHPQLIRARADIETAKKQSLVAAVSNSPTTILETSLNTIRNVTGDTELFGQFQLRVVRNWDAYDGGAAEASKKATDARINAAENNYESIQQELETTLDTQWTSLTERQQRIDVLFRGVSLSEDVRDTAKIQFTAGRRSLLDLLNFEADVFNAKQNLALEQADLTLIQIRLLSQSGRLLAWANQ